MSAGDWIAIAAAIPGFIALGWRLLDAWRERKPLAVQAYMETGPYGYIINTTGRPVQVIRACFRDTIERQIHWVGSDRVPVLIPAFEQKPVSITWINGKPFEGYLWVQDAQGREYKAEVRKPVFPKALQAHEQR